MYTGIRNQCIRSRMPIRKRALQRLLSFKRGEGRLRALNPKSGEGHPKTLRQCFRAVAFQATGTPNAQNSKTDDLYMSLIGILLQGLRVPRPSCQNRDG